MKKKAICTIVSLNYLAQALNLTRNVREFHSEIEIHILIVDKTEDAEVKQKIQKYSDLAEIEYVSEIGIDDFDDMVKRYGVVEMNTAVKPYFMEYLLKKYKYETIMYIDSDILLFHDLDKVYELLEEYSVVLTPHLISQDEDIDTEISKLDDFLQYGIYNLGFVAVRNDENGLALLKWWAKELKTKCYLEPDKFLAWDQKWMDFAPALFNKVYILRDPGYNAAFWNIQNRFITCKNDEYFVNEVYPLVFYHFSHYRFSRKDRIAALEQESRCMPLSKRKDLMPLYESYRNGVMEQNYEYFAKLTYGFQNERGYK